MKRLLFLLALLLSASPAAAQYVGVNGCGTPPATMKAGVTYGGFIDINTGNVCIYGAGGSASTNVITNSTTSSVTTNFSTVNNVPITTGKGTGGAGSVNVYIASDQPAYPIDPGCASQTTANTSTSLINLASTTTAKLVTKATGKNVFICAINLVSATAQNVALIAGTKTTNECDTSTAGLAGGTTAATGWNLAANGGLTAGNGMGVIAKTASTGLDVCLTSSSTGQISGSITWAQF